MICTWEKRYYRKWQDGEKIYMRPHRLPKARWREFWQSAVKRGWNVGELTLHQGYGLYPSFFWKWREAVEGEPLEWAHERPQFYKGQGLLNKEKRLVRKMIFSM